MATVTYTPYNSSDHAAVKRTCQYILDGHGNDPYAYTTRYIADGHGGTLFARGYGVVADAELAAKQMDAYKEKYKKNHPITKGTNQKKKDVDVVQMYLSFGEQEKLNQNIFLEIVDEFLVRTGLDAFPVLIAPHYNTEHYHVHLVICAYSRNGQYKLAMNNEKLYQLRRTMDYICVEHGLSIVEPEYGLLRDPEYREFYENIVSYQTVPVIPRSKKNKKSRRKNSMQAEMDKKMLQKCLDEEHQIEQKKKRKNRNYYYTHPNGVLPYSGKPIYVYKYDAYGRERSLVELMLILLYMMAFSYAEAERHIPPGNIYHAKQQEIYFGKTDVVAQRAADALMLSHKYQIKTEKEVQIQKAEVGKQMNHCKAVLHQQQALLENTMVQLEQMDASDADRMNVLRTCEIIQNRIQYQEEHLKKLKKEYRDLSWMGVTLERQHFENELQSIRYMEKNYAKTDRAQKDKLVAKETVEKNPYYERER